jgi:lipopolysaccharide export system permease protein
MNKVDKYIFKSFIGPFILTFFISLFILLLQFLWKYIQDLVGKGLDWWVILKLLFYASANMVPLALPIAVLLASIMTYGNLGERFELAAFKSAGISMVRFMRSTIAMGVVITVGAFLFSNYVLPTAYLKFVVTLVDITKQKPALNIRPNEFYNEIEGYSIYIGGKSDDNVSIREVTIYEETDKANDNVLIAESGQMLTSADKQNLIFTLHKGRQYEELKDDSKGKRTHNHLRMNFDEWHKTLDLSGFQMTHTSEDLYQNHYKMLNISQLVHAIDSLYTGIDRQAALLEPSLNTHYLITRDTTVDLADFPGNSNLQTTESGQQFLETISQEKRWSTIKRAIQSVRNISSYNNQLVERMKMIESKVNDHRIEWHRKFSLSLACLLFVFVGAPLGAIIRKGGFGLPVIFSIVIFIFYYVMSILGEKMAEQGVATPLGGMWMSTCIVFPFCVLLTIKAKNDAPVVDSEWYYIQLFKIRKYFSRRKNENTHSQ